MFKNFALMTLAAILVVFAITPAFAGTPMQMGDYVWFDENNNGLQDEGPDAGINGVRVMFYRDYECNGVIDGYDALYDYDFTSDDVNGLPGYYMVPSSSGRCFLSYLDPNYIPVDMIITTDEELWFLTGTENYLDADFGLSFEQTGPDFVCPKTIGFWKQQFTSKKSAKYTKDELNLIVEVALNLTDVFASADEIEYYLNVNGNAGALARAKKQFAALTLNLAAYAVIDEINFPAGLGESTPLDLQDLTDAASVGSAWTEVEYYILSGTDLGLANDIADAINNGEGVELKCEF